MPAEDKVWSRIEHEHIRLELEEGFYQLVLETENKVKKICKGEDSNPRAMRAEIRELLPLELEKWLRVLNNAYIRVWRTQGNRLTPEFVRTVFRREIKPTIDKPSKFEAKLVEQIFRRAGMLEDWDALPWGFWLDHTIRLEDEWRRRTEIQAMRLKYRTKRRGLRGVSEPKSRRGRKRGRPGLRETAELNSALIEARDVLSRTLGRRPLTTEIVEHFIQKGGVPLPNLWRQRDDIRDWRAVSRSRKYLRLAAKRFGRVPHKPSSL